MLCCFFAYNCKISHSLWWKIHIYTCIYGMYICCPDRCRSSWWKTNLILMSRLTISPAISQPTDDTDIWARLVSLFFFWSGSMRSADLLHQHGHVMWWVVCYLANRKNRLSDRNSHIITKITANARFSFVICLILTTRWKMKFCFMLFFLDEIC